MKASISMNVVFFLAAFLGINASHGGEVLADEICRPCPFDCAGIGAGRSHCEDLRYRGGQCCVDLDGRGREQLRQKDEENSSRRFRYGEGEDRSGRGGRRDPGAYDDRFGYSPGDCPAGYHVNERNCTNEERARGCSDLRSPSGQICVGWGKR